MKIGFLLLLCVCVTTLSSALYAQGLTADDFKSDRPTPRMADGHPDFSGYWKGTRDTRPVGNIGKDLSGFKLPLTPAGEAALQHNLTATIDPESLCIIGGIPRHNASALPFEILQGNRKVAFLYFYTYYRLIPIDPNRKHSKDPDPSFFGEELGRWEGDTLVIDSIGFKDERVWIDENANPHSDALTHAVKTMWTGTILGLVPDLFVPTARGDLSSRRHLRVGEISHKATARQSRNRGGRHFEIGRILHLKSEILKF